VKRKGDSKNGKILTWRYKLKDAPEPGIAQQRGDKRIDRKASGGSVTDPAGTRSRTGRVKKGEIRGGGREGGKSGSPPRKRTKSVIDGLQKKHLGPSKERTEKSEKKFRVRKNSPPGLRRKRQKAADNRGGVRAKRGRHSLVSGGGLYSLQKNSVGKRKRRFIEGECVP